MPARSFTVLKNQNLKPKESPWGAKTFLDGPKTKTKSIRNTKGKNKTLGSILNKYTEFSWCRSWTQISFSKITKCMPEAVVQDGTNTLWARKMKMNDRNTFMLMHITAMNSVKQLILLRFYLHCLGFFCGHSGDGLFSFFFCAIWGRNPNCPWRFISWIQLKK